MSEPVYQKSSAKEWLIAIVSALVIALIIRGFFYAPYEVHGASMQPTLEGEELLIVNKWIYKVSQPKYGDIVVFHTVEHRDFIKRVIGLPGDKIVVKGGKVYRNGIALEEPYIKDKMVLEPDKETIVQPGYLYVLGDNRNNSKDSRSIGPVNQKAIVGRAELVVWPFKSLTLLTFKSGGAVASPISPVWSKTFLQ